MGSVMRSSYDAQGRACWGSYGLGLTLACLKDAQGGAGSPQSGHQGAEGSVECSCGLLVRQALNGYEVERCSPLLRQAEEGLVDLLEVKAALLLRRDAGYGDRGYLLNALGFCLLAPPLVNERV